MLANLVNSLANNAISLFRPHQPRNQARTFGFSAGLAESGDMIEISQEARMRQELVQLLAQVSTYSSRIGGIRYKNLPEVRQDFLADLAGLKMDLIAFLQTARIDMQKPIVLQPDGKGHILVANGHSQSDKINGIFSDNPALVSRFMVMAARGVLTQAAEISPAFREAYASNPPAAIREHIGLLKTLLLGCRLQIEDGDAIIDYPTVNELALAI